MTILNYIFFWIVVIKHLVTSNTNAFIVTGLYNEMEWSFLIVQGK